MYEYYQTERANLRDAISAAIKEFEHDTGAVILKIDFDIMWHKTASTGKIDRSVIMMEFVTNMDDAHGL